MKNNLFIFFLCFSLCSCAKMSMPQKLGTVLITGGIAGGAVAAHNQGKILRGLSTVAVGSLLPAGGVLIASEEQATPEQEKMARQRANKIYTRMSQKKKAKLKKKKIRYLAVDTKKTKKSRGRKNIMIWDTKKKKLATKKTYDVRLTPNVGETAKFDTFITEYVGGEEALSLKKE